jgi:hypothetical protein
VISMMLRLLLLNLFSLVAGQARQNDLTWNALTPNALTFNSFTDNGLVGNGLTGNALAGFAVTQNALAGNALAGNALASNALASNALASNALASNAFLATAFMPNGLQANALTANAIVINALASNSSTNNGNSIPNSIVANAVIANALLVNALSSNGLEDGVTVCFNVTNYNASLESCEDGTTNSLKNGTICLDITGEPLNVTDSNCDGEECTVTAQELALLVLSSLDNTTTDGDAASRPLVHLADLAARPLRGDNLPTNVSLILAGEGGETAQHYMVELLNYTVSCALRSDQSVTLQVSGQPVVLNGSLGLTPNWARQRIAAGDQETVSACLAARLNFFGVHVEISIRGNALDQPSAEEVADYSMQEGAFWGNIFKDDEPELFACTNKANLANSYETLRFCSNGFPVADGSTISCGPLRNVGSCDNWCTQDNHHHDQFNACGRWQQILSVYLPPATH